MNSKFHHFKNDVLKLRRSGKTYGEINQIISKKIPKSTLSEWFKVIDFTNTEKKRIFIASAKNSERGRILAVKTNIERRKKYLQSIVDRNKHLKKFLKNKDSAKVVLAILYLGEGRKTKKGSLMFGNSDPYIISLFLYLLRFCYNIDENKFRCTVQCRADQNTKYLERFWSDITKIPLNNFYKARIDPRTIGKVSKNPLYKGVCRIDYFSADVFLDLMQIPRVIYGPVAQW